MGCRGGSLERLLFFSSLRRKMDSDSAVLSPVSPYHHVEARTDESFDCDEGPQGPQIDRSVNNPEAAQLSDQSG